MSSHEKVDLYITCEIKSRELDAAIWTAIKSVEYGFRPIIGTLLTVNRHILKRSDQAAILLHKSESLARIKRKQLNYISHFCIMDQEIGPSLTDYSTVTRERVDTDQSLISRWYTVGPLAQDAGSKIFGHRSIMTGWPRVDLWHRLKRGLLTSEYSKPWERDYVLLALTGNHKEAERFSAVRNLVYFWGANRRRLGVDLVVRPHPVFEGDDLENMLNNANGVYLNKDLDSLSWVENCRVLIHDGSTLAVTAALLGKRCISLGTDLENELNFNSEYGSLHRLISRPLSENDQIFDLLGEQNLDDLDEASVLNICRPYIFISDKPAAEILLEDLRQLDISRKSISIVQRLKGLVPDLSYYGYRSYFRSRLFNLSERRAFTKLGIQIFKDSKSKGPDKMPGGLTDEDFERFRETYSSLHLHWNELDEWLFEVNR